VEEELALLALDEAKALVRNQLLDRAFCHSRRNSLNETKKLATGRALAAAKPRRLRATIPQ
jgi:hypothetical protein